MQCNIVGVQEYFCLIICHEAGAKSWNQLSIERLQQRKSFRQFAEAQNEHFKKRFAQLISVFEDSLYPLKSDTKWAFLGIILEKGKMNVWILPQETAFHLMWFLLLPKCQNIIYFLQIYGKKEQR